MANEYIVDRDTEVKPQTFANRNIVTVALALGGKQLNKTIFADGRIIDFKNAYHYKFFSKEIECLDDLCQLVRYLLHRPKCCLLRGVAKDDTLPKQRRLLYDDKVKGDPATIIEQEQNWYALDVDNYDKCSGDLKQDAQKMLLALGLSGVQAFAIPSASYLSERKPGINIRLFLWNSARISCLSLKKHFTSVVDSALFSPIQAIYVARPTFIGMADPCSDLVAWIPGDQIYTEISDTERVVGERSYRLNKRTKKQAEAFLKAGNIKDDDDKVVHLWDLTEGNRHRPLYKFSSWMGELIWQELLDEDEVIDELLDKCMYYWRGNTKNDDRTIRDGIRNGKEKAERDNEF